MKGTGKKKSKFVTILGVLLVICGLALIAYPFIEIKLDEKDISKNISEWDKKKVEVAKEVKTNNKSNQKYPTVNIDGKDIIGKIIENSSKKCKYEYNLKSFLDYNEDFYKTVYTYMKNKIYILDIEVPSANGIQVAEKISLTDKDSTIIFVSDVLAYRVRTVEAKCI